MRVFKNRARPASVMCLPERLPLRLNRTAMRGNTSTKITQKYTPKQDKCNVYNKSGFWTTEPEVWGVERLEVFFERDRGEDMAIEIKVLQPGNDQVLMNVAAEVFDNSIDPELTREFLEDPRHHIAVAIDDGAVVGFASGVHYVHPDKPAELWINEVAIAPTHRRRGLGKSVLQALFKVGRAHKCKAAWVLTDRINVAAMALYSSVRWD
jgi:ribosomal protein S18 acetylase RimI-like enzyme